MKVDRARALLRKLIDERQTDLKTVSLDVCKKNHSYLQQYFERNTPLELPETVRENLGAYFGRDPDDFRAEAPSVSPDSPSQEIRVRKAAKLLGIDESLLGAVMQVVELASAATAKEAVTQDPSPEASGAEPSEHLQTRAHVGYAEAKAKRPSRRRVTIVPKTRE